MNRNLDKRVETLVQIDDPLLQARLEEILAVNSRPTRWPGRSARTASGRRTASAPRPTSHERLQQLARERSSLQRRLSAFAANALGSRRGRGVKLYLIRHAKAESRAGWWHEDVLRPLSPAGHGEAMGLVERLDGVPIARVISSPALRCRQTVEPLAARSDWSVEIEPRLGEGSSMSDALALIGSLGNRPVVLCSHGDLIPGPASSGSRPARSSSRAAPRAEGLDLGVPGELRRAAARRVPAAAAPRVRRGRRGREGAHRRRRPRQHVVPHDASPTRRPTGTWSGSAREREMLRLGAAIGADGLIPPETCERAVDAARRLGRAAERAGAEEVLAIATAALRDARNGRKLAEQLGRALERRRAHPVGPGGGAADLLRRSGAAWVWATSPRSASTSARRQPRARGRQRVAPALRGDAAAGVARLHGELEPSDPMTGSECASCASGSSRCSRPTSTTSSLAAGALHRRRRHRPRARPAAARRGGRRDPRPARLGRRAREARAEAAPLHRTPSGSTWPASTRAAQTSCRRARSSSRPWSQMLAPARNDDQRLGHPRGRDPARPRRRRARSEKKPRAAACCCQALV